MSADPNDLPPRRSVRHRDVSELLRNTALGGLAAGLVVCAALWPAVRAGEFVPGLDPTLALVLVPLAGAAVGLGVAGSATVPLCRAYGPGSGTARLLSFVAGMLAAPIAAAALLLWLRVSGRP